MVAAGIPVVWFTRRNCSLPDHIRTRDLSLCSVPSLAPCSVVLPSSSTLHTPSLLPAPPGTATFAPLIPNPCFPPSHSIVITVMSLDLGSRACFRGFSIDPATCVEFSPCGQRLAFCSPRGAVCIANLTGSLAIQTMSPPGGHFASALSWENDRYLWVALSNGHVIQLHLPTSGDSFTISDWLTYRFPSDSCVQKIVRLIQNSLVAVAFADRVEIWRRKCTLLLP